MIQQLQISTKIVQSGFYPLANNRNNGHQQEGQQVINSRC